MKNSEKKDIQSHSGNTVLCDCAKDEPTKCPKCKGKSLVKYRDGKQCSFCLHIV